MQVAKSGVIKIQLLEKFLEFQKKFPLNNQFKVDHLK